MKLYHLSDLHLGIKPGAFEGDIYTKLVYENLKVVCEKAVKEKASFVLIAGDVFDSNYLSSSIAINFLKFLKEFSQTKVYFHTRWRVKDREGREFSIGELSDGASAQLLLSARLALIEMFCKAPVFLLFDEPFAYFDRDRREKTLEILKGLTSQGHQLPQ